MFVWMKRQPLMDLDGGASGGESSTVADTPAVPATPVTPMENPLLRGESPASTPSEVSVRMLNFAGREVPVIDPVIEDVHRDYTELTRTFTQTNQAKQQLETQNQQLQAMLQFAQQSMAQQQQAPTPTAAEPSPEEVEAAKEAFMESFYSDPQKAIRDMAMQLIQQEVTPVINPINEERKFQMEAKRLSEAYADFGQTVPAMQELVRTAPELENLGLEKVYLLAKNMAGGTQQTQPPAVNAADLRQQLMNDTAFKEQIFNQMLQEKQQQQAGIPPVMANQPGGGVPAIPENRPKNIREGSMALMRHLGINR